MSHVSESQLALHYYSNADDPAAVERHLADCDACRREFDGIRATLSSVAIPAPERPPDYEASLWNRLAPQLQQIENRHTQPSVPRRLSPFQFWIAAQRWAPVGAMAALITVAFFLGRLWERAVPGSGPASSGAVQTSADAKTIRHRVLMIAVESHLDRTQLLLAELANADPAQSMDISAEETAARALLEDNRLYRQTAAQAHDEGLAQILDELERFLVDLSHRPPTVSQAEWREIQQRIESQGILFKIRVVGSEVREQEREMRNSAARKMKT